MKVGEGYQSPQPDFRRDLEKSMQHFRAHLKEYQAKTQLDEKDSLLTRMDRELSIMDISAQNFKKETRVQEQKVHKDFEVFRKNPSDHNASILEHDLSTLEESLKH